MTALSLFAMEQPSATNALTLAPSDRILILAPHPDDEVLGCGGIIQQSVAMKLPLRIVYFTYGDNNEWSFLIYRKHAVLLPSAVKQMGLLRHDEAVASAVSLGVSTNQLTFLGYPDFGTLRIWISHWGNAPPYESLMTKVTRVPYANAMRPGAPYLGQEISRDLTTLFREFNPTKIFVSHPADFNVDHRALFCFTRLALWDLEKVMHPEVYPYLVHFPQWPDPRGDHQDLPLRPPLFFNDDITWQSSAAPRDFVAGKEKALKAHHSQFEYASHLLRSFLRTNELFGDFPVIRFPPPSTVALAPTSNKPHYEGNEEDQLTESERNGFVGLEWRHIRVETNAIKVSIELSRPLAEAVSASIHVFGYRQDTPFQSMPKIQVEIGALGHSVHDQHITLPAKSVRVSRHAKELEAEIPMALLGHPERLFVSARTYLGEIPLDWVSWRIVTLVATPYPATGNGQ